MYNRHCLTVQYFDAICAALLSPGADIIKDDGVYASSVLASDLNANGRYNIKVKVNGYNGKVKVIVGGTGRSSGALEQQSAGQWLSVRTTCSLV